MGPIGNVRPRRKRSTSKRSLPRRRCGLQPLEERRLLAIDLGTVRYEELLGVAIEGPPAADVREYRFVAPRDGTFTVEAAFVYAAGDIDLALERNDSTDPQSPLWTPLAAAATAVDVERIDHSVVTGKEYRVLVAGDNPSVDLRFANILAYRPAGLPRLEVYGTWRDEELEFVPGAGQHGLLYRPRRVLPDGSPDPTVRALEFAIDPAYNGRIWINGNGGSDHAFLAPSVHGPGYQTTALLVDNGGIWSGPDFEVWLKSFNFQTIELDGGTGLDRVWMADSPGDDMLVVAPNGEATLYLGALDPAAATSFYRVHGYNLIGAVADYHAGDAGEELAYFEGTSQGNEYGVFIDQIDLGAGPVSKVFASYAQPGAEVSGHITLAIGFTGVWIDGKEGVDAIWFNDTPANDAVIAAGDASGRIVINELRQNPQFLEYTVWFENVERVQAAGGQGSDRVEVALSAAPERIEAGLAGLLRVFDAAGQLTFDAAGFARLSIDGRGGGDTTILSGSPGDDLLWQRGDAWRFSTEAAADDPPLSLVAPGTVEVAGGQGVDRLDVDRFDPQQTALVGSGWLWAALSLANDTTEEGGTSSDGITSDPSVAVAFHSAGQPIHSIRVGWNDQPPQQFTEMLAPGQTVAADSAWLLSQAQVLAAAGGSLPDGQHLVRLAFGIGDGRTSGVFELPFALLRPRDELPELSDAGWTFRRNGSLPVAAGQASAFHGLLVLRELSSLLVEAEAAFTIPEQPGELVIPWVEVAFDRSDPRGINDALELAVLDAQGQPLVAPFTVGRDAFGNVTEGPTEAEPILAGAGLVLGAELRIDLSWVAPGTLARFVARLVNNDADAGTTATIRYRLDPPPTAVPDEATVAEDSANNLIDVLSNDLVEPGEAKRLVGIGGQFQGTASIVGGLIRYTPAPDFFGVETIEYLVDDGLDGHTATGTLTITVSEVNDPPQPGPLARTTPVGTPLAIPLAEILAAASPGPFEAAQQLALDAGYVDSLAPAHGTWLLDDRGTPSADDDLLIYTPAALYFGLDAIGYRLVDNGTTAGLADPLAALGTIQLQVLNAGIAAVDDAFPNAAVPVVLEDTPTLLDVTANDTGLEPGEQFVITRVEGYLAGATVEIVGGQIRYTPPPDYVGPDSFVYYVHDGLPAHEVSATVAIEVAAVNDPPTAGDDVFNTASWFNFIPFSFFLANDAAGPANEADQQLTIIAASGASHGIVSISAHPEHPNSIRYESTNPFAVYIDTFQYTLADQGGSGLTATGTVTVRYRNNRPQGAAASVLDVELARRPLAAVGQFTMSGAPLEWHEVLAPAGGEAQVRVGLAGTAGAAQAPITFTPPVRPTVHEVVLVIDHAMGGWQPWMQSAIDSIQSYLGAAAQYSLVTFGGQNPANPAVDLVALENVGPEGPFGSAADLNALLAGYSWAASSSQASGHEALRLALDELFAEPRTAGSPSRTLVLFSPREAAGVAAEAGGRLVDDLAGRGVRLHVAVQAHLAPSLAPGGLQGIGLTPYGAIAVNNAGWYSTHPAQRDDVVPFLASSKSVDVQYIQWALASGGTAWDLSLASPDRQGDCATIGNLSCSWQVGIRTSARGSCAGGGRDLPGESRWCSGGLLASRNISRT